MNKSEREVFYQGKKIEIRFDVKYKSGKCIIIYDGNESYIEYTQYFDNQEVNISVLKVHELCRKKGIGLVLMSAAIQNCQESISRISIKACAENEEMNKFRDESGYQKPRTQEELEKYYKDFSVKQNGDDVDIIVCK